MTVAQSDILKAVLVHLLVLFSFNSLPVFDNFSVQFPACSTENCVLRDATFEFFKLVLDFFAFSLLFIKFGLKLARHSVVSILSFFEVETDLVNICEGIEVLVLV